MIPLRHKVAAGGMILYKILWNEQPIGTADVIKEGLYYKFSCICKPVQAGVYKIIVFDGQKDIHLGICVPLGEVFVLNTKIASKHFNTEHFSFRLMLKEEERTWIPVNNEIPFAYLDKLENTRLQIVNKKKYIVIDSAQDQQDNGQNQVYPKK